MIRLDTGEVRTGRTIQWVGAGVQTRLIKTAAAAKLPTFLPVVPRNVSNMNPTHRSSHDLNYIYISKS